MSSTINNNRPPTAAEQAKTQQKKQDLGTGAKISGQKAAANLATMLASQEAAPLTPKTQTSSLLGPMIGENSAAAASAPAAPTAFSLLSIGDAPDQAPLGENLHEGLAKPGSKEWRTEVGVATSKALAKASDQLQARVSQLVTTAQQALANNPQLQQAAIEAQAAANAGNPQAPGKASSKQGATETESNVFVDLTEQAHESALPLGINLKNMPIEDAVVFMMMMCSQDARGDMKDMLAEMELTRRKKAALREADTLLKEQQTKMRDELRAIYDKTVADKEKNKFEDWAKTQPVNMPEIKLDYTTGRASLVHADNVVDANADKDTVEKVGGGAMKFADIDTQLSSLSDRKDSLSDLSQEQQLRMQMVMERMTKMDQMASNLSKKLHDTLMSIVSNLK